MRAKGRDGAVKARSITRGIDILLIVIVAAFILMYMLVAFQRQDSPPEATPEPKTPDVVVQMYGRREGGVHTCIHDYRKEKCGTCRHMFIGMDGPFCGVKGDGKARDDPACRDYAYSAGTAAMLEKYDRWLEMIRRSGG